MPKYHTLVGIRRTDDRAEIIFGSFTRSEVKFEMDEYNDKKRHMGKESEYLKFAILTTDTETKLEIEAATADWELQYRQSLPISNPNRINL